MLGNKRVLAVVPARAGSKGLPGKNYRDLLGKPLFMWSVEAGIQSKYVDEVVVSSNCPECENIYHDYITKNIREFKNGVDNIGFIIRPEELSTGTAKSEDALIHSLKELDEKYDLKYDVVIMLQPTSPCRLNNLLDTALEEYELGRHDSLLTATKDTPFLWQKVDGNWEHTVDKNDCCNRKMRQEFNEEEFVYHDNGCIYITDVRVLMETGCRIGSYPYLLETSGINSLQIDEEHDFELIEQMAKIKGLKTLT